MPYKDPVKRRKMWRESSRRYRAKQKRLFYRIRRFFSNIAKSIEDTT